MSVFDQCELRFDRQYVTADCSDKGSAASRYGNWVHKTFEIYLLDSRLLPESLVQFGPMLESVKNADGDKYYEWSMSIRADKTPCKWNDPLCWQRGIVDLAIVNVENGIARDWKTGRAGTDGSQLQLMAAFMFVHFPLLQTINTKYKWLFHPKADEYERNYTRDMLPSMWSRAEMLSEKIDNAVKTGVFAPKPGWLCSYCPASSTCKYAKKK